MRTRLVCFVLAVLCATAARPVSAAWITLDLTGLTGDPAEYFAGGCTSGGQCGGPNLGLHFYDGNWRVGDNTLSATLQTSTPRPGGEAAGWYFNSDVTYYAVAFTFFAGPCCETFTVRLHPTAIASPLAVDRSTDVAGSTCLPSLEFVGPPVFFAPHFCGPVEFDQAFRSFDVSYLGPATSIPNFRSIQLSTTPVPEPSSIALLATGAAWAFRRRRLALRDHVRGARHCPGFWKFDAFTPSYTQPSNQAIASSN